jgi:hypothetical protein
MSAEENEQINRILTYLSTQNPAITKQVLENKHTKRTQLSALKKAFTFNRGEDKSNKISKSAWAKCMKCTDKEGKFTSDLESCLSEPILYDAKKCTKKAKKEPKETLVDMARDFIISRYHGYNVSPNPNHKEKAKEFLTALVNGKKDKKKELAVYIKLLKEFMPNIKGAKNKETYVKRCISKCKGINKNETNMIRKDCIQSTNRDTTRTKYDIKCEIQDDVINGKDKLKDPVPRVRKPKIVNDPFGANTGKNAAHENETVKGPTNASLGGKKGKRTKQKRSQKKRTRKASFFGLF